MLSKYDYSTKITQKDVDELKNRRVLKRRILSNISNINDLFWKDPSLYFEVWLLFTREIILVILKGYILMSKGYK